MVNQAAKQIATKGSKTALVQWIVIVALTALCLIVPTSELYTYQLKMFMALTVFCIAVVAFDTMPILVPCALLPVGYLLFGVAPIETAFSCWSSSTPWMFLGVFIFANALTRVGLLERVGYWFLARFGKSYLRVALVILLLGLVLSIALPGGNAHAPVFFFVLGILQAMGVGKSKDSAFLMVITYLGTWTTMKFIYNPYIALVQTCQQAAPTVALGYGSYLYYMLPFVLMIPLVFFVAYRILKPEGKVPAQSYFIDKAKELGAMTADQKRAAICTAVLLVLVLTTSLHHVSMAWVFFLMGCFIYFPAIGFGNAEDIRKANWGIVFFVAACISIGNVGLSVGFNDLIGSALTPLLSNVSVPVFFLIVLLAGFAAKFLLPPLAVMVIFSATLTPVAVSLGINPLPVWFAIIILGNFQILPYQFAAYKFGFSYGLMEQKDYIKIYLAKSLISLVLTMCVALPWWYFVGLL
ncbi:SLC13 family permease [Gordonibacter sp.]|uniref:SLC13 family permease n=3 Tax=Gordonibacter sp. TaxID=1968902 RepID=UPI002FCA34FE